MFSLNHWHFFSRDFWVKWQLNIMEHKSISKHQLQGRLEGKVRKFSHMCRLSVARLNLSPCSPQSFELKMWNGRGETCLFSIRPSNLCSRKHFIKIILFFFSRKSNFEFEVKEYKYRILFNVKNKLLKICSNIIKVLLRKYITGDCMTTDQV